MAKITINTEVAIPNGPKLGFSQTLEVEAFDKIDVTIPAEAKDKKIQVLPSNLDKVQLVLIMAEVYDDNVSYTANKVDGTRHILDQPLLITGSGGASMLDSDPLFHLFFTNENTGSDKDAKIQILIGRNATVPDKQPPEH